MQNAILKLKGVCMPIDFSNRNRNGKSGLLSLLRLTIPNTGELLNVGVILQNTQSGEIKIKTVEELKKVQKCFNLSDTDNIEYSLEMLCKRQFSMDTIYQGEVSNSILVSEPSRYIIMSENIEDEIEKVFSNKVSLSHQLAKKRNLNPLSKTMITSKIKDEIKQKKWDKIIKTRKHLMMEFGESKEMSLVSEAKNNPIVVAQLISLYVDFLDTFQNALSLKYLKSISITDRVVYMPLVGGTAGFADKIRFVKEQSDKEGFRLVDSADSGELLGFMKEKADKALFVA